MRSLNTMLLALVVTNRINIGDIRRERQKTGRKTTASHSRAYFQEYKARKRFHAIGNGICVHCFAEKSTPGMRTCQSCRTYHQ